MNLEQMLSLSPVVPVLVIERVADAVPLARALVKGGLPVLEVTLRTPAALESIARIAGEVEGALVGVGTVLSVADMERAAKAGARFAVSPGFSATLSSGAPIPLLPGVATASEVMSALDAGHRFMKLFPAESVGGARLLHALFAPLPQARFCPTGGVTMANAPGYLALPNVICVGGSWLAPAPMVADGEWSRIEGLASQASSLERRPA